MGGCQVHFGGVKSIGEGLSPLGRGQTHWGGVKSIGEGSCPGRVFN